MTKVGRAQSSGSTRQRPVVPPIHSSTTYFLDDIAHKEIQEGGLDEVGCRRLRNLTVDAARVLYVETLATHFNSLRFSLTPDERDAARIEDGMIRVSGGVEPTPESSKASSEHSTR